MKGLTTEDTEGTERATPETDDQPTINAINDNGYQVPCVDIEFARKLERERDEAQEELARIESLLLDPHAVFLNFLHGKIAKLDWQKLEHIHGPHPARKTPAWIPVFQALPDDGETVIIHTLGGEVWTGFIDAGVWRNVAGARIHEEEPVLHWRPFPDPPQQ